MSMNKLLPTISFAEMQATMDSHVKSSPQSSPVDTAKAGILEIIQDRNLGPKQVNDGITAILEALYQDAQDNAGLERKVKA